MSPNPKASMTAGLREPMARGTSKRSRIGACSHAGSASRHGWGMGVLAYTEPVNILALDTSTEALCLALCSDAGVVVHEEPAGARSSARLLPAAQELLHSRGLSWGDLQGLVYGQGPGAFTGLRAACSTVQGLALGLNLEVMPISSLLVVAECARQALAPDCRPCTVKVAVDARMDQVYDAAFFWDGRQWSQRQGCAVRAPSRVFEAWWSEQPASGLQAEAAPCIWAGSGLSLMDAAALEEALRCGVMLSPGARVQAQALTACAVRAWREGGEGLDAAHAVPLYVRDQVALTLEQRQSQPAGTAP